MPTLKEIADRIKKEIDDYAVRTYDDGDRDHLGASIIGKECNRAIYFTHRWIGGKKFDGRMQRLFRRGHREELAFREYLRGIGFTVRLYDPDYKLIYKNSNDEYKIIGLEDKYALADWEDITDDDFHILRASLKGVKLPQLRISDCNEHFGGSLDAELEFPSSWNIPGVFLGEFKTKGTGKGFDELAEKGVMLKAQEHWAQMCSYGYKRNIEYAVYFTVNKNDDNLHIEVIKLDRSLGADMIRKARNIIDADRPPEKLSESPTFFKCKICDFYEECHNNKPIAKNCRSCHKSKPVENGQWYCKQWNAIIPHDAIRNGCDAWLGVI